MNIITTEEVNEILEKCKMGKKLTRNENIFYQGMSNARKANLKFAFTQEELDEYVKCKTDFFYFIETYCKIKKEGGKIDNIKIRDYQKDILKKFDDNRFTIIMKSLQMGIDTILSLYFLHFITFNGGKNILHLSNKKLNAMEVITNMQKVYLNLPFFLKRGIRNWGSSYLLFDNDSGIRIQSRTKEPAIGFDINILYISYFAHIPENIITEYYSRIVPVVSSVENSKIIISSPPNGVNLFYRLFTAAEAGKNNYIPIRSYWWQVEGRDEKWKQEMIQIFGEKGFAEYFDLCFKM